MSPLDHKLLRNLWRIRGQACAVSAVMAVGILLLVMLTSLHATLVETRNAYYDRYRMADIFVPLERAPNSMLARAQTVPGVAQAQSRVTGTALIDLPGEATPASARVLSLPYDETARLNDVVLIEGQKPEPTQTDQVLLLKRFADARGFKPGDHLTVTMNGARHVFEISGLARSPEFIYATAPGEFIPDDKRFAAIWMDRATLGKALDLTGAFNEVLIRLDPNVDSRDVIDAVNLLFARQGGLGAYSVSDQQSDFFLSQEIAGAKRNAIGVPPLFLAVAAYLLYVVVNRIVQTERGQIGLLKAFGYSNQEISWHYFKLIMVIALAGTLVGSLAGMASGRVLASGYQDFYKFPFLLYRTEPLSFLVAFVASVGAALTGSFSVLKYIFKLTAADAMRPPAPSDYRGTSANRIWLNALLDQPARMLLRRIQRYPIRMAAASMAIAGGMALAIGMMGVQSGFATNLDLAFSVYDRSDAQVTMTHAVSDTAVHQLSSIPGVSSVEPIRIVPTRFSAGFEQFRGSIDGIPEAPVLKRVLTRDLILQPMPDAGIVLSTTLANALNVKPGNTIMAEVLEGNRPKLELHVAAVVDTLMGTPAYMSLDTLNTKLGEGARMSGASLRIDGSAQDAVLETLKSMPNVAGVVLKSDVRAAIKHMMDTGMGALRFVMLATAGVVSFGMIYNSARITFAERTQELATMRVLGFTRGETAFVLLGELGFTTICALPLGAAMGFGVSAWVSAAFSSDVYTIPLTYYSSDVTMAAAVVIGAAAISGLLVKRDMDLIDPITELKTKG